MNNFCLVAGNRRIVDYTADPVNGFNAVVRREPAAIAAKAPEPYLLARQTPSIVKVATPLARFAPAPVPYRQDLLQIGSPVAIPAQPQFTYHL